MTAEDLTWEAFQAILRRAGLSLPAEDEAEMFAAHGNLRALAARLRNDGRSRMAEPLPVVRLTPRESR